MSVVSNPADEPHLLCGIPNLSPAHPRQPPQSFSIALAWQAHER